MAKNNCICVLYDEVADNYSAPITFANEDAAIRYTANICKQDPNAKDYKLYAIADYNSETAMLVPYSEHKLLAKGVDYVKKN